MYKYVARIAVPEGKLKEILERIDEAMETIREGYTELGRLGVLKIEKEATGGNQ